MNFGVQIQFKILAWVRPLPGGPTCNIVKARLLKAPVQFTSCSWGSFAVQRRRVADDRPAAASVFTSVKDKMLGSMLVVDYDRSSYK